MTSRWKKVWADFWGNKSRTFLTIVTIAVGTFAVGFNVNLGLFMNESLDSDFISARPSEATIFTSPLDDKMVDIARSVPGVNAVEGRSISSAFLIHSDGKPISIQFTAIEDPNTLTVNLLKPAKGETILPPLGDKQILVDSSFATLGYAPGDTVTIELFNGKHRKLKVAGYVHDVIKQPYGLWGQTIYAYVTPDTMEWLGGSRSYNTLAVSVAENPTSQTHVTEVAQAVADRMEEAGATVDSISVIEPGHHFSWNVDQGIFFLLGALGYMIVFLSGFLIINTITALMSQHTRQIGIMKAVGGRTGQIFGMYIILILIIGLIALVVAIPLAGRVAKSTGIGMGENLGFFTLPFKIYPQAIIQQIVVALVVPLLAAILPIYNSVRVTIREALTNYGIGANTKPKDKSVGKSALWIPRPMRLSLRNAFRRKTRLALTLISLVLGGSIFIGVYNIRASFDKLLNDVQGYILADVNISFERYYRFEEVSAIALGNPGVSSAEGWLEYPGTFITNEDEEGTQITFVGVPTTSTLIDPLIAAGRWLRTGDENAIVVSNFFLNTFPEVKIGDWLTIKIDDKETNWQIVGLYTNAIDTGILYVNYEYLSHITGRPDQVRSLRVPTRQHDPTSQSRIADELRGLYEAQGIQVTNTQTATDAFAVARSIINILVYFMTVMAVLIAVVGGLGLMGTMSINVMERTREIGVMRAIGASNGDIQAIVIVEGMVIGLISWAISILVSIPITGVVTYGVGIAIFKIQMAPVYNAAGITTWLIFTLVLAAIASALPARQASRLTVKDTLAYE
jgi:putative ABC transport system permease protein